MHCPSCDSTHIVKNGIRDNDKQNYRCQTCSRQFVENPSGHYRIDDETCALVDRLLLERLPLAEIARAVQVSESWLHQYVNKKYAETPREVDSSILPEKENLTPVIECDEMWSFVGDKWNKQWLWLAIDRDTRIILAAHIGDRGSSGAQGLWENIPTRYRSNAHFYTDYWEAYQTVIPSNQHDAVGKHTGLTNHIERFNLTMRQRVSRLVRLSLSFSKKLENHIGAIWYFIHYYNRSLV